MLVHPILLLHFDEFVIYADVLLGRKPATAIAVFYPLIKKLAIVCWFPEISYLGSVLAAGTTLVPTNKTFLGITHFNI